MARNRGNVPKVDDVQITQPKLGKPVEIPVPTRGDVMRALAKTARPTSEKKPRKDRRATDG